MARHGIFALLAAAVLSVGVNAGPCKPYSSVNLSSTITLETTSLTQEAASSTITADVTDTTDVVDTTVTEGTTQPTDTTVLDTTITESTDVPETTTALETTATETTATTTETTVTEPASETSTTLEPTTTTTTTAGPIGPGPCVETQILVNPSFDDNNDATPWTLGDGVTVSQINPRSDPNFLYNTMTQARKSTTFSQSLPALDPGSYRLDYYFNLQTAIDGRDFSCQGTPSINGVVLASSETLTDNGPYGFRSYSQSFSAQGEGENSPATLSLTIECQGSFDTIIIGADDFALTRICGE